MIISEKAIRYGLGLLDNHLGYILSGEENTKEQKAYYNGLREMLEILISDWYEKDGFVSYDKNGKHYIGYKGGRKQ